MLLFIRRQRIRSCIEHLKVWRKGLFSQLRQKQKKNIAKVIPWVGRMFREKQICETWEKAEASYIILHTWRFWG